MSRAKEVLRHLQAHDVAADVGVSGHIAPDSSPPEASGDGALSMPSMTTAAASGVPTPSAAVEVVRGAVGKALKADLEKLDPERMTPIDALIALSELKRTLQGGGGEGCLVLLGPLA